MYISSETAKRIKQLAISKDIVVKEMLAECGLNRNTLSSMLSRGSWIKTDSMAKIADYLDCSIDYLMGRTDKPDINN